MAQMIPPHFHPDTESLGEREIFRRLKDGAGTEDWIVLHSLDIVNHVRQVSGEIDFVVIIPKKGILCLEVKACTQLRREYGEWYYGSNPKPDLRGPFKQASLAMHSLRRELTERYPELSGLVFWSAAVFPYVKFTVMSTEWHPWQVIDSQGFMRRPFPALLENVIDRARIFLRTCPTAAWFSPDREEPSLHQCEEIADVLRGRFEFFESTQSRASRTGKELRHFTEEQYSALDAMEQNPRVIFTGPAGTGKTLLAIEAARRARADGKRVLLLCYNRLLGKWLETQTADLRPEVKTTTLHRYMLETSGRPSVPSGATAKQFWETELPEKAADALMLNGQSAEMYDQIIIDEAQDIFRETYLDVLDLSLQGGLAAGQWRFFGDFEKQAISDAANLPLNEFKMNRCPGVPEFSLRTNCRNTPRIASLASLLGALVPGYTSIRRPDDNAEPSVSFYESALQQREMLTATLQELYTQGFSGEDIVVLSPKASECCAASVTKSPWRDRLRPFEQVTTGYVGFTTLYSYKGLEAQAVIVTDIEHVADADAADLFYIGATRAVSRLVIFASSSAREETAAVLMRRTDPAG